MRSDPRRAIIAELMAQAAWCDQEAVECLYASARVEMAVVAAHLRARIAEIEAELASETPDWKQVDACGIRWRCS